MKNYVQPVVLENEELAEGIYAASGAGGSDCYTVTWNIHQQPETGREDFRIQVNAPHAATNGHHSGVQILVISYNQSVTYKSSQGTLESGDGTNTLRIRYQYHNNGTDNIGLGDLVVEADPGVAVTNAYMICNYDCGDVGHHNW